MTTTDIADRPSQLSVDALQRAVGRLFAAHSVTAVRISLGLIIAGFGALKFVPGWSPAEQLVEKAVDGASGRSDRLNQAQGVACGHALLGPGDRLLQGGGLAGEAGHAG